jgi:hypothetical protein
MTGKHTQLSFIKPQYKRVTEIYDTCDTYFNKKLLEQYKRHIHTFIECILLKKLSEIVFIFPVTGVIVSKTLWILHLDVTLVMTP